MLGIIYPQDNNPRISSNPHSLSLQNDISVPDTGNPFVATQKRFMSHGLQGMDGLGGMFGISNWFWVASAAFFYYLHRKGKW